MGKLSAAAKAAKEIAKKAKNESMAYRRKLKNKLMNEELTVSPSTKAKQQKINRVKELEKDIALENPYMTYEDRVELLGGKYKKGGKVKKGYHKMPDGRIMKDSAHKGMKKGGKVSSCSKRADGCAVRGKTKGRMI